MNSHQRTDPGNYRIKERPNEHEILVISNFDATLVCRK